MVNLPANSSFRECLFAFTKNSKIICKTKLTSLLLQSRFKNGN